MQHDITPEIQIRPEGRFEAAAPAVQNSIAGVVKLADVTDNMDLGRIADPEDRDFERLKEYVKIRKLLIDRGST